MVAGAAMSKFFDLRFSHVSMQFSDNENQKRHDANIIFDRGYHIVNGTEAGPGAGRLATILGGAAINHDYRFFLPKNSTDTWIAVHQSIIHGDWSVEYFPVIPAARELEGAASRWGEKGLTTVAFDNDELGRINVGCAHYLTQAKEPGSASVHGDVDHWKWNKQLGKKIGNWATEVGRGSALAFYSGDQNMADSRNNEPQGDTFFGHPLTSAWDELKKWEGTGHGPIDVIASYDGDGRVEAKSINALNDRELFLHTDHFMVEAVYRIKKLGKS